ncbi:hypothetical protein O6H91_07G028500 [Diphasiastrum complanatum]|uniref:Uncharacterized protein n=3 Tax=Diphasiastrum complanatum TaxID=34168 RepID=A0ACC2D4C1_DIPCM|nr:hypothetical protein O6H91_07G028500 [Diphasiastrum complanatum]KAJ7548821.1 hypothetical protein O6H91_07G028500 [Diphasiastrum complanatum]KAJ7548822.1 hypothetical protein O6H91_07G028500 [Diphasiastrum complanatum]
MKNQIIFSKYVSFLGPALLVSIGYMDPGNWATAIEGGSRFGYELIWTVVLSNLIAILLQSLAARLGLVTGKHLAQVCHDEYPRPVCVSLWLLCEASLVALDMAMVLGTATGLNLLLGLPILACVLLVAMDILFLMFILPFLGVRKAELIPVSIVGVVLLSVVLSALFSKPSPSAVIAGVMPRLRRDSLYTTVSLLGANIAPHNLYLHSALVLVQRKASSLSIKEHCKHNLVEISFALGAAIMVNLAVLLVAAATFHNAGLVLLTLQDAHVLMQHVLSHSVSPLAFGLALLCAGQLSTLTGTIIGQVVIEGFFGTNIDAWLHRLIVRAAAVVPAILCAWKYGNEGIYQMLIFSQIVLALQLPFMVIPLIKATSSQACMSSNKSTVIVEFVAWIIVALAFILNLSLILNMLLAETDEWGGSTSWEYAGGLSWVHVKFGEAVSTVVMASVLVVVGLSVGFFIWLILTPLNASSYETKEPIRIENYNLRMITERELEEPDNTHAVSELKGTPTVNLALETVEHAVSQSVDVFDSGCKQRDDSEAEDSRYCHSSVKLEASESVSIVQACHPETVEEYLPESANDKETSGNIQVLMSSEPFQELKQAVNQPKPLQLELSQLEHTHKEMLVSTLLPSTSSVPIGPSQEALSSLEATLENSSFAIRKGKTVLDDLDSPALKEAEAEADEDMMDKEDDDVDGWENLEHEEVIADVLSDFGGSLNSVPYDGPESGRSIGGKSDTSEGGGGGSGSGSLSRLSGLGRAARRHFASILDDFWGRIFDLHGVTLPQSGIRSQGLSTNTRNAQNGRVQLATFQEGSERNVHNGSSNQGWRTGYKQSSVSQPQVNAFMRAHSHASASPCDRFGYGLPQDSYLGGAPTSPSYVDERRYSSMRFPTFHEEVDYQPATIHGYNVASNHRTSALVGGPKARPLHLGMQSLQSSYGATSLREPVTEPSLGHLFRKSESVQFGPQNLDYNRSQVDHDSFTQSYTSTQHTGDSFVNSLVTDSHFGVPFKESHLQQPGVAFYDSSQRDPFPQRTREKWNPLVYRATGELDIGLANLQTTFQTDKKLSSFSRSPIGRGAIDDNSAPHIERTPLAFDQIAPSQMHIEGFSLRTSSKSDNHSLWSRQPFEQLFGTSDFPLGKALRVSGGSKVVSRPEKKVFSLPSGVEFGIEVLESLRVCIAKLLQLEGSDWLFRVDNGSDEDLIAAIAAHEKFLLDSDASNSRRAYRNDDHFIQLHSESHFRIEDFGSLRQVPHCGDGCIWGSPVLISFGVWCVHRVLELSLMESRPELWGKYTYVLNHLQGILEPAFGRPRTVPIACICIRSNISPENHRRSKQGSFKEHGSGDLLCFPSNANSSQSYPYPWPWGRNTTNPKGKPASSALFVDMIKEVEAAVGSRKGRTGTAAGDVAFPKGKENLASVLKRYKRRLGNKSGSTGGSGNGSGKKDIGLASAAFLHLVYML